MQTTTNALRITLRNKSDLIRTILHGVLQCKAFYASSLI